MVTILKAINVHIRMLTFCDMLRNLFLHFYTLHTTAISLIYIVEYTDPSFNVLERPITKF
jgi:hypothetical protein